MAITLAKKESIRRYNSPHRDCYLWSKWVRQRWEPGKYSLFIDAAITGNKQSRWIKRRSAPKVELYILYTTAPLDKGCVCVYYVCVLRGVPAYCAPHHNPKGLARVAAEGAGYVRSHLCCNRNETMVGCALEKTEAIYEQSSHQLAYRHSTRVL